MKVLGSLPDMAERIAISFLEECCRRIQAIYPPGARITICSDGRIFSDLVRISEEDVTAYMKELQGLIDELGAVSLDLFSIDDAFDIIDFEEQRQQLLLRHATPVEELHRLVKSGDPLLSTFNGIARFLFEDIFAIEGSRKTRNSIRSETKRLAYRVIQRSLAWSALIAERFPRAVRLSIHPHPPHSEKIGIYLVETLDNWLSPWHGVAVDIGGHYVLMKRYEAESLGASLVWLKNRPSHFVLPRDRDTEDSFSFARAF
jgi:L-tyrosine isonitrile synthase